MDKKTDPDIATLRDKLLGRLIPVDDFAPTTGDHPKTLSRRNPPIVYIGRTRYIPEEEGREWLLNDCKPAKLPAPRRRGRPPGSRDEHRRDAAVGPTGSPIAARSAE